MVIIQPGRLFYKLAKWDRPQNGLIVFSYYYLRTIITKESYFGNVKKPKIKINSNIYAFDFIIGLTPTRALFIQYVTLKKSAIYTICEKITFLSCKWGNSIFNDGPKAFQILKTLFLQSQFVFQTHLALVTHTPFSHTNSW